MMRAMFSGVTGLKVHQTRMDVIGNNIANVNTIGFKSATVTFADILYQTSSNATGPSEESGRAGQNAMQVGLGVGLRSILNTIETTGGAQRTDNPFDIMIEGDGFFIVNNGSGNYFTRAGSFTIDTDGTLCNANGYAVMGWQVDPNDPNRTVADTVTPLKVMSAENQYSAPEATTAVHFAGNIDSADASFDSEKGKMTTFTFYNNLGRSYTANVRLEQVEDDATGEKTENQYEVYITDIQDSDGNSILVKEGEDGEWERTNISFTFGGQEYDIEIDEDTGKPIVEGGDPIILEFDSSNGSFRGIGAEPDEFGEKDAEGYPFHSVMFSIEIEDGDNPFDSIDVDFSALTMYAQSGTTKIEPTKGSLDGIGAGRAAGTINGVTVDNLGKLYGVYDNGTSRLLGQIVIAQFANPSGLEAIGGTLFSISQNSGEFDGIGVEISSTGGKFNTGVIEMSNVDLSREFTDMITTQRGFQANSRIITTSDSLLEELLNLKR